MNPFFLKLRPGNRKSVVAKLEKEHSNTKLWHEKAGLRLHLLETTFEKVAFSFNVQQDLKLILFK